jgi:hypothetical protein
MVRTCSLLAVPITWRGRRADRIGYAATPKSIN